MIPLHQITIILKVTRLGTRKTSNEKHLRAWTMELEEGKQEVSRERGALYAPDMYTRLASIFYKITLLTQNLEPNRWWSPHWKWSEKWIHPFRWFRKISAQFHLQMINKILPPSKSFSQVINTFNFYHHWSSAQNSKLLLPITASLIKLLSWS